MTTQPSSTAAHPGRSTDRASAEIRAWAARLDLRQRDIAQIIGVSQGQASARLRGLLTWNLDELDRLAAAFGIDVVELLTGPPSGGRHMPVGAKLPHLDSNQEPAG